MSGEPHGSTTLPVPFYEAMGRMLVSFQALEDAVTFGLFRLSREPDSNKFDKDYILALYELSFRNRLKLLRSFMSQRTVKDFIGEQASPGETREILCMELMRRLTQSLPRCEVLEAQRNTYVHSSWEPSEDLSKCAAKRFKIRVEPKKVAVVLEEVCTEQIVELNLKMQEEREIVEAMTEMLSGFLLARKNGT